MCDSAALSARTVSTLPLPQCARSPAGTLQAVAAPGPLDLWALPRGILGQEPPSPGPAPGKAFAEEQHALAAKKRCLLDSGCGPLPAPGGPLERGATLDLPGRPVLSLHAGFQERKDASLGLDLGVKVVQPPSQDARSTAPMAAASGGLPGPRH